MGGNFRWAYEAFSSVLVHLFDLIEDIEPGCMRVKGLLFYFWRWIFIIF
jgi:hypothetical protein